MKIEILLFGVLSDIVSKEAICLDIEEGTTVAMVLKTIYGQFPQLCDYEFRVAVNQTLISDETTVKNGDKMALLPPFAGG